MALAAAGAGFNWHDLVVQALGFALLALVLWKWVVPVLRKMSGERTHRIEEQFAKLDRELAETAQKVSEYQHRISNIGAEAQKRLHAAQEEGTRTRYALMGEAQAQAKAEMEKAKREVQIERDKAILELRAMVAELTVAATEKVVDAVMNEQLHDRLVRKYLAELDKVRQA